MVDAPEFIYYDLPYFLRFWKKGSRGALLYFYLWQMTLPFIVLKARNEYDVVHSLNFHSDWTPSFLWILGRPFVWGPINHNEPIPADCLIRRSGYLAYIKDRLKFVIKVLCWNVDPFLFLCRKKAQVILCGNRSVVERLHINDTKAVLFSQVGVEQPRECSSSKEVDTFIVMTAGRMIDIKSFDLAISAFAKFIKSIDGNPQKVKLLILGHGELLPELKKLVSFLGIEENVDFTGWIDKGLMPEYYSRADVFLFTSHEGGGMVVAEAQSYGVPVVCFNNYGPGETVTNASAIKVNYRDYKTSVIDLSEALKRLYLDRKYLETLSMGAVELSKTQTWESKGKSMSEVYESI
jgi:glycosyltransferase involved in cell wall biosynthesis